MSQESGPGSGEEVADVVKVVDEDVVEVVDAVVPSVVVVVYFVVVVVEAVEVVVDIVVVVTPQEKSSGFWGFHLPSSLHQMSPWASPSQ